MNPVKPAWLTSEFFSQKVQPLLASVSTSEIRSRMGVSRWYASKIRQVIVRIRAIGLGLPHLLVFQWLLKWESQHSSQLPLA
jgi:hypothetical protein